MIPVLNRVKGFILSKRDDVYLDEFIKLIKGRSLGWDGVVSRRILKRLWFLREVKDFSFHDVDEADLNAEDDWETAPGAEACLDEYLSLYSSSQNSLTSFMTDGIHALLSSSSAQASRCHSFLRIGSRGIAV